MCRKAPVYASCPHSSWLYVWHASAHNRKKQERDTGSVSQQHQHGGVNNCQWQQHSRLLLRLTARQLLVVPQPPCRLQLVLCWCCGWCSLARRCLGRRRRRGGCFSGHSVQTRFVGCVTGCWLFVIFTFSPQNCCQKIDVVQLGKATQTHVPAFNHHVWSYCSVNARWSPAVSQGMSLATSCTLHQTCQMAVTNRTTTAGFCNKLWLASSNGQFRY